MNRRNFFQAFSLLAVPRMEQKPVDRGEVKRFLAVDIDLCWTGVHAAYGHWVKMHDSRPTVLWVMPYNLALANSMLDEEPLRHLNLVALSEPKLSKFVDTWSVGTRQDFGYGSYGC